MSVVTLDRPRSISDEQQYRLLYGTTFLFFLASAAVGRAFRFITGQARVVGTRESIVAEARAAGSNALLYAFLG